MKKKEAGGARGLRFEMRMSEAEAAALEANARAVGITRTAYVKSMACVPAADGAALGSIAVLDYHSYSSLYGLVYSFALRLERAADATALAAAQGEGPFAESLLPPALRELEIVGDGAWAIDRAAEPLACSARISIAGDGAAMLRALLDRCEGYAAACDDACARLSERGVEAGRAAASLARAKLTVARARAAVEAWDEAGVAS